MQVCRGPGMQCDVLNNSKTATCSAQWLTALPEVLSQNVALPYEGHSLSLFYTGR